MVPIIAQFLLFLLLTGMAASVDVLELKQRVRRWQGLAVGLFCQFCILPLLGFLSVKAFELPPTFGLSLLAVTSSPGGAYSNWWCSMFNADLALSIAMTTCSTLLSLALTPANMVLYMYSAYGTVPDLNWGQLVASIVVAFLAICCGLCISFLFPGLRKRFNVIGNVAGLCLIIFSAVVSTGGDPIWGKKLSFYVAVSTPILFGLLIAFPLSMAIRGPSPQEAIAVTVETCYQNTGLALTIALSSFDEEDRAAAAQVPLFYGCVQVVILPLFLFACWKAGFTYAKPGDSLCHVLLWDHQPGGVMQVAPQVSDVESFHSDIVPSGAIVEAPKGQFCMAAVVPTEWTQSEVSTIVATDPPELR